MFVPKKEISAMDLETATRVLADNLADGVVVCVARHDVRSLPTIIADEVRCLLLRIAEKQGWSEWPNYQIKR
jgi:hypothetical protein